jgi:hypothetical protein
MPGGSRRRLKKIAESRGSTSCAPPRTARGAGRWADRNPPTCSSAGPAGARSPSTSSWAFLDGRSARSVATDSLRIPLYRRMRKMARSRGRWRCIGCVDEGVHDGGPGHLGRGLLGWGGRSSWARRSPRPLPARGCPSRCTARPPGRWTRWRSDRSSLPGDHEAYGESLSPGAPRVVPAVAERTTDRGRRVGVQEDLRPDTQQALDDAAE